MKISLNRRQTSVLYEILDQLLYDKYVEDDPLYKLTDQEYADIEEILDKLGEYA